MLANKLMGGSAEKLYVDDVFSTYLYTGNGSTQTINNGIDLAGEGGLVWTKGRSGTGGTYSHELTDTARGATWEMNSNGTYAQNSDGDVYGFTSTGFNLRYSTGGGNISGTQFVSWTFRKAPKFFDIVTYTGDGVAGRQIPHELGIAPGMIVVKCLNTSTKWVVSHRGVQEGVYLSLNTSDPMYSGGHFPTNQHSDAYFSVNTGGVYETNWLGFKYVAYLWAHDLSEDGIIQCGSYAGNGSTNGPDINLGWEPQYVIIKRMSDTSSWIMLDSMRGMPVGGYGKRLMANSSSSEADVDYFVPTATGIKLTSSTGEVNANGHTYIYLAIRRPNKPPTSGTEVYSPLKYTSDGYVGRVFNSGFQVDSVLYRTSNNALSWILYDRLRGIKDYLIPDQTRAEEVSVNHVGFDLNHGIRALSTGNGQSWLNESPGAQYNMHFFRRAPGFFDVVCYTGTGVARTVPHGLGVAPELMIVKSRNTSGYNWAVYVLSIGASGNLWLNLENSAGTAGAVYWNSTSPSFAEFTVGTNGTVNQSGITYIAYLFASLPGISKVGSYTGNGTSQVIPCGFTTGARFVLIKRTDSTGDWLVADTARGIVAANDPRLSLNTNATEVTTEDWLDPDPSGFIVNQVAGSNANVLNGQYIFLAIA